MVIFIKEILTFIDNYQVYTVKNSLNEISSDNENLLIFAKSVEQWRDIIISELHFKLIDAFLTNYLKYCCCIEVVAYPRELK